jgi:hypothetical protein
MLVELILDLQQDKSTLTYQLPYVRRCAATKTQKPKEAASSICFDPALCVRSDASALCCLRRHVLYEVLYCYEWIRLYSFNCHDNKRCYNNKEAYSLMCDVYVCVMYARQAWAKDVLRALFRSDFLVI